MTYELLCAGFGGQGVMLMGQILAYAAAAEGKKATWFPSYGPEMRGGTANCQVVVSDQAITSPILSRPQCVIVLNKPSFLRFEPVVKEDGLLIVNSSLIELKSKRVDLKAYYIPATEVAQEIGSAQVTNMVLLGAYLEEIKPVSIESVKKVMEKTFSGSKAKFLPLNLEALERGREFIKKNRGSDERPY